MADEAGCWTPETGAETTWTTIPRQVCSDTLYTFYDTVTDLMWLFDPVGLAFEEILSPDAVGGWILNDGFRLWIADGFMYFGDSGFPEVLPYVDAPVDTLEVVDGILESNP